MIPNDLLGNVASWFVSSGYAQGWANAQSWDGLEYSRDGHNYCYVWVSGFVDMDLQVYFLLDVRTHMQDDSNEWREFLFVSTGMDGFTYKSFGHPIRFEEDSALRLIAGLNWMTIQIQKQLLPEWSD